MLSATLQMRRIESFQFTIPLACFLLDSALVCVPQSAVRIEAEPARASPSSTTGKSPRLLLALEKWRTGGLSRSWAGIHPIPHKFQRLPFKVQSLPTVWKNWKCFYLLLSSTVMLVLLTVYKDVSSCLEIGQMKYLEQLLNVKICFPFS